MHVRPHELHKTSRSERTFSQKAADSISSFTGSWKFIIGYMAITVVWVTWNTVKFLSHFDKEPFILYTFSVSVLAILMSSIILLSQNRQSEVDRDHAENAYSHINEVNGKQDQQLAILSEQTETMIKQHKEMLDLLNTGKKNEEGGGTNSDMRSVQKA